ncbi:hypothetical protein EON80_25710 [bacterium]|nr:MAG: hypothetical protein EON80_25710 [bacterium]
MKPPADQGKDNQFSIVSYAAARAGRWPGESRILIEREWAQTLAKLDLKNERDFDEEPDNLRNLVSAMARIDPLRALEMAEQLPTQKQLRAEAKGELLVGLLSQKD